METSRRAELQRLLTRLADGERDAFHPAFVLLWPVLRRFAGRHLPAADAEDAAQQALLKAFFHAARFDRERDALSWVLGIAANEVRTAHRKRRREVAEEPGSLETKADLAATPEEAAITRDLELALEGALGALRPADARTLALFARDERPDGVAGPTFRKRLERALGRLRQAWKERHGPE